MLSSSQYNILIRKIGPDRNLLLNSFGQPIPNLVESLLATIRLHFGDLSDDTIGKHTEIHPNMRIRRVEDYPWYKNTFFARIYKIPDPFSIVWKEKFLAVLPKGFSQLVRENLSGFLESLPYSCLFSAVEKTIAELCSQKKIVYLKKWELSFRKGGICDQFGIRPIVTTKTRKKSKSRRKYSSKRTSRKQWRNYRPRIKGK